MQRSHVDLLCEAWLSRGDAQPASRSGRTRAREGGGPGEKSRQRLNDAVEIYVIGASVDRTGGLRAAARAVRRAVGNNKCIDIKIE